MEIRPATEGDLAAQYDVFRVAIGELFHRHSFSPPDPPREVAIAHQRHLLEHDGERCFVAEEGGRVVAFVAAMARGDAWFLASLFILPDHQGLGIGKQLLERTWGGSYGRRLTLTDSIQPISNGLYARRGLIPIAPVPNLAGMCRAEPPRDLEAADPDPESLELLDLAAYGFSRALDHPHWARFARATVWMRAGRPAAYSYAWPHGRIGPIAGVDGAAAAAALQAEIARRPGDHLGFIAPGSSSELIAAGLEAGLRFTGPPGLLLLSPPENPPRSLALSSYSLF